MRRCSVSSLIRCVSIATCTCVEPVSASLPPCFAMISCFASLVRPTPSPSFRHLRLRPRRYVLPTKCGAFVAGIVARAGPGSRGRVAKSGMASAIPQQRLAEIVREARARTGVPAVAAGLLVGERVELAADGPVDDEMVHGLARGAPPRPRCAARERCERAATPLTHGRPAAELEGVAPRGVPRALVVLERGLRARRRRVRGCGELVLL